MMRDTMLAFTPRQITIRFSVPIATHLHLVTEFTDSLYQIDTGFLHYVATNKLMLTWLGNIVAHWLGNIYTHGSLTQYYIL